MWMWELDHKESWAPKSWCFQTVVLEKTLESHLDSKEIKSVNPKGNQPWRFNGKTGTETKALIVWPPDVKSRLIGEDPDAGEDGRQKEKGAAEDKMGWLASPTQCTWIWANSRRWWEGQESLACCSPWGHKELDMTWQLNYQHNFISEVPFKICL